MGSRGGARGDLRRLIREVGRLEMEVRMRAALADGAARLAEAVRERETARVPPQPFLAPVASEMAEEVVGAVTEAALVGLGR